MFSIILRRNRGNCQLFRLIFYIFATLCFTFCHGTIGYQKLIQKGRPVVLPYTLLRSKRKTLSMEITPEGSLLVRAPLHLPEETIRAFVEKHEAWALARLPKARAKAEIRAQITPELEARLRRAAERDLFPRVQHWAAVMRLCPARCAHYRRTKAFRKLQRPGKPVFFVAADAIPRSGSGICRRARAGSSGPAQPQSAFLRLGCAILARLQSPRSAAKRAAPSAGDGSTGTIK